MRKKFRIELQDEDGTKYTLGLEGSLSRDKVMKVMDLIDMLDIERADKLDRLPDQHTFFGRLLSLIDASFSIGDFSSSDLAREFEERYNKPVRLSTISTYLSRLAERNYLTRHRFGNSWVYRHTHLKISQPPER